VFLYWIILTLAPYYKRGTIMRRSFVIGLYSTFSLLTCAAPTLAAQVAVPMDEVRLVVFKQPASSVYMGNPTIAEVTTVDPTHVFVLGKTFGTTNMIALGANGRPIANEQVVVFGRRMGMVTLQRGSAQYNYSCTSAHCESAPAPGDQHTWYQDTHSDVEKHEEMGAKSAVVADSH
jgi:hypothetical protein